MKEAVEKERDITVAAEATNVRLREVETSLAKMKDVVTAQQNESENDDLMSAVSQLEEEQVALKSIQILLPELLIRAKLEEVQKVAKAGQNTTISVTFGDNNEGFQVGVSHGNISGVRIGRGT